MNLQELTVVPLTPERWEDFETLFGEHGAYGGCWCMWWRVTRSEFEKNQGEGNRLAMRRIVESGEVPGVLAYCRGEAIAWCSIAPRGRFASLNRSPVLRPIDPLPVWSLVCLFVARAYRGQGVTEALVRGAVAYARAQGARVVEAYPTIPQAKKLAPVSSFMGVPEIFERAGFVECSRPSRQKAILRYFIESEEGEGKAQGL